MGKRKTPKQNLNRPLGFNVRFNKSELNKLHAEAKRGRLSMAEFARRKILDIPVGGSDVAEPKEPTGPKTVA